MNKLTEQQKQKAFEFMDKCECTDFDVLAIHLSRMFKIQLTGDDAAKLYMSKAFGS